MKTRLYDIWNRAFWRTFLLLMAGVMFAGCERTRRRRSTSICSIPTGIRWRSRSYGVGGGMQDFLMYSNYGHWQLVPTYAEDVEWISFWPAEGVGDARFSTLVKENKTAYRRYGELNVVVDGESVMVLKFNQEAAEPVLEIDMGEAGKTVSVKGRFTVNVTRTSTGWPRPGQSPRCGVGEHRGVHRPHADLCLCGQ